jgi:hypothetical protein
VLYSSLLISAREVCRRSVNYCKHMHPFRSGHAVLVVTGRASRDAPLRNVIIRMPSIVILINGASSLHILSLHSAIASAVYILISERGRANETLSASPAAFAG